MTVDSGRGRGSGRDKNKRTGKVTGGAGKGHNKGIAHKSAKKSTSKSNKTDKTLSELAAEVEADEEHHNSDNCVAYLDTEFNAFDYYGQNEGVQEIIEIGLVVMRGEEVVDGFRSYCALKYGHSLTRRSEQLTGIKPRDIENASSFADVIEQMNAFLNMYNPRMVCAYGPEDRMQLIRTAQLNKLKGQELYYINKIQDIMRDLSERLGARKKTKLSLSVKDICAVCGIDAKGIHDAYNDALYLGRCAEKIMMGDVDPERLDAVLADKNWISGYRQARRFRDKRETVLLRDEQLEPIREAVTRLSEEQRYPDNQLRALLDDLLVITGRDPEFD